MGKCVEDKFKDYLLINEFDDLFVSTTEGLKEQDTQLREKTLELEETVKDMKAMIYDQVPWQSTESTTNVQMDNDMKSVQADIRRFQQKMREDIEGAKKGNLRKSQSRHQLYYKEGS